MAPKRKAIPGEATTQGSSPPISTSKAKKPKADKRPELPVAEASGWILHYPYMMLSKTYGMPEARSKIAAFELDGTLVGNKQEVGRSIPDADNWRFASSRVKEVVRELVADNYALVIFTNQGWVQGALEGKAAAKVKGRIDNIMQELGVPAQVLAATAHSKACDPFRKPAVGMWKYFEAACNAGQAIVLEESVFVGSAAGRNGDFADSDKEFAKHAGLPFKVPEDIFGVLDIKKDPPKVKGGENHNPDLEKALRALATQRKDEGGEDAPYKSRALHNTADIVKAWPAKIEKSQDLADIKGIGRGSRHWIDEFIKKQKLDALDPPKDGGSHAEMAAV